MRHIYSRAEKVIVSLGEAKWCDGVTAFDMLGKTSDRMLWRRWISWFGAQNTGAWNDLAHLCRADYWKRLWIVQEIGLASKLTLFYGHQDVAWQAFSDFLDYLPQVSNSSHIPNSIRELILRVTESFPAQLNIQKQDKDGGFRLETLLKATEYSICQEPRDKIYGLLGLARDFKDGEIKADYSKSLFAVYEDVMWFQSNRSAGLAMVSLSELVQRMLKGPFPLDAETYQTDEPARTCITTFRVQDSKMISIKGFCTGPIRLLDPLWKEGPSQEEKWLARLAVLKDEIPKNPTKWLKTLDSLEDLEQGHTLNSGECGQVSQQALSDGRPSRLFVGPNSKIGLAPSSAMDFDLLFRFQTLTLWSSFAQMKRAMQSLVEHSWLSGHMSQKLSRMPTRLKDLNYLSLLLPRFCKH